MLPTTTTPETSDLEVERYDPYAPLRDPSGRITDPDLRDYRKLLDEC